VRDAGGMARATIGGLRALRRKRAEVAALERERLPAVPWDSSSRRVLYLKSGPFSTIKVGGSVGHVAGVANALARAGLQVRMLAAAPQLEVAADVEQRLLPPPKHWALPVVINAVRYSYPYWQAAAQLVRDWAPSFTYQRFSPHDLTGAHLRALGLPWVLEYNGSEVWAQRNWGRPTPFEPVARAVEVTALRSADLVVTVSEPLRREVIADGVPEERVLFFPNCIDPHRFDPDRFTPTDHAATRAQFDLAPGDLLLTFIGTFGLWHGTDVLADAIRHLIDTDRDWLQSRRIRFLFVGSGLRFQYTADRLGRPGDEEFVRLAGVQPQDRAPAILAASDVLLSPHRPNDDGSAFFGSPTKLFEYLAMARPIVASDLDQIGDVARGWRPPAPPPPRSDPTRLMLLVTPGDVADLVRGIREACELTPAERAAMGRRGREAALASFTWDANVAAVMERLAMLQPAKRGASPASPG
jgi:Glycosyltransferase